MVPSRTSPRCAVAVRALVRLHGAPVGHVTVPVVDGRARGPDLAAAIADELGAQIAAHLLADRLAEGMASPPAWRALMATPHPAPRTGPLPPVTVAVCTRDRAGHLRRCLAALQGLDHPDVTVLVVDNAPRDGATRDVVAEFAGVRYVVEPRPGLDHARNAAIVAADTELLAFADDDVVVDPGWATALAAAFRDDPEVMAVTGLVVPAELRTEAQVLFEHQGGFGKGYRRRRYVAGPDSGFHLGAGEFGTGANMAFRRAVFDQIGGFDPRLDVGTPAGGGGDLEMFFRVLEEGHPLVYEPAAVVRHVHRPDHGALAEQMGGHGSGLAAFLARSARAYPHRRRALVRVVVWWLLAWMGRRAVHSATRPTRYPADLQRREFVGFVRGALREARAHRSSGQRRDAVPRPSRAAPSTGGTEVVRLDLAEPVGALPTTAARRARVYPRVGRRMVGRVDVTTQGHSWPAEQLRVDIAHQLGLGLVAEVPRGTPRRGAGPDLRRSWADALGRVLGGWDDVPVPGTRPVVPRGAPPPGLTASVVIATHDRPEALRVCLTALMGALAGRDAEVVVVDNHPASGLTAPVLDDFPEVVRVREARRGSSYARNAGFRAAGGDVLVCLDDDVTASLGWFDALLAPFARADVGAVTGNVLPLELDTAAQRLFEAYGGLGRGERARVLDPALFESRRGAVPTWEYGATANAAFRRRALLDPGVGLFEESLGAGMPAGVGEDTYLFYRLVKRGWSIAYTPDAVVWHRHRRGMQELEGQLRAYSSGHVAYHLTTLFRDGDLRALARMGYALPRTHASRTVDRLRGRSSYPLRLIWVEVRGNLAGPLALWQSRRRVRRLGRSEPLQDRPPEPGSS